MAAIYVDVDDLLDAMEELCPDVKTGYRTTGIAWLNALQLEWQAINPTYEGVRTLDGSISLTAETKNYAFTTIDTTCVAVDTKSFHDGKDPVFHKQVKKIRQWDRGWDDTGRVTHFSVIGTTIRVWKVPDAANVILYPKLYCDYFKRFEPFTAETDLLTQYLEQDRLVLLKGLEWRAKREGEDPEWEKDYVAWQDMVRVAGRDGGSGAIGISYRIGLGPYFEIDEDDDEEE